MGPITLTHEENDGDQSEAVNAGKCYYEAE